MYIDWKYLIHCVHCSKSCDSTDGFFFFSCGCNDGGGGDGACTAEEDNVF